MRGESANQRGFTLAQMAVVILLSGILMTMGVLSMRAVQESAAVKGTQKKLEMIEQALKGYLSLHHRLPCPDAPGNLDGQEDRVVGPPVSCVSGSGVLPFVDLKLQRSVALDGWDRYFSYHVSTLTTNAEVGWDWVVEARPSAADVGDLVVRRRETGGGISGTQSVSDAVVVVISHGRNGFGGITLKGTQTVLPGDENGDEYENVDNDAIFIHRDVSERETYADEAGVIRGAFDDLLLVMQGANLVESQEGVLYQQARQELTALRDGVVGYAMTHISAGLASLPDFSETPPLDPWNAPYLLGYHPDLAEASYKVGNTTTTTTTASVQGQTMNPGDLLKFSSQGAKSNDDTDDLVLTMTIQELQAILFRDGAMVSSAGELRQVESQVRILNEAAFRYNMVMVEDARRADPEGDVANDLGFVALGNNGNGLGIDLLIGSGFVGSAMRMDRWEHYYRWDRSGYQFFSTGPDKVCGGEDDVRVTFTEYGPDCADVN